METPFIPSWNRVVSAIPDILSQLKTAVELDNQEFSQVLKESNTYASAG
jgi:glucosyl-3-phosphoglycerate synthase